MDFCTEPEIVELVELKAYRTLVGLPLMFFNQEGWGPMWPAGSEVVLDQIDGCWAIFHCLGVVSDKGNGAYVRIPLGYIDEQVEPIEGDEENFERRVAAIKKPMDL